MVMVDCGYTFPESESYGVDYILPDWSYVMENLDKLDAVLITHGHQDHIGALPYFLGEVDVPVYSGRMALAMLEGQLEEHGIADEVDMYNVAPNELLEIGPFLLEFLEVNHSVPDARSIALDTPVGNYIFTGDWKLDHNSMYEPVMDLQGFADYGQRGVRALFGDSTNAMVDGHSRSEAEVQKNISSVMDQSDGRVIVSMFSSNQHRLGGLLEAAHDNNRKVLLLGRSLRTNFATAREEGYVDMPHDDLMIRPRELNSLPDEQVLVVCTGSQAEPRAALTRMSRDDHHHISLRETDRIILSARQIPGNTRGIESMIDDLARQGAEVIQSGDAPIHGSGHAQRDELKLLLNLTKPETLVPVHGRYSMRYAHAGLGRDVGIPDQRLIENGDVLEFTPNETKKIGNIPVGRTLVDGKNMGDLEDIEVRDRANMAESGIVVAYAVVDKNTGELAQRLELIQRGFLGEEERDRIESAVQSAEAAVDKMSPDAVRNENELKTELQDAVQSYFNRELNRTPVVVPIIHQM